MISAATPSSSWRRPLGGERGVVERLEDAAELQLSLQHGAAGGLGRVRGDARARARRRGARRASSAGSTPLVGEHAEGLGERFARDLLLALVAAPAAHAMPRLGDVGELEVEAERAQDRSRALLVERTHAGRERRPVGRGAGVPGLARQAPDALDVGEQILAALLDEDTPERVADQADVAPQRVVATAQRARGRIVGGRCSTCPQPRASPRAHARAVARHPPARPLECAPLM